MGIESDKNNEAVDKVLATLREATPPEGMGVRIAQRLQQSASAPQSAPFRWRYVFANSADTAAWWRGAIAGAATVSLIGGALLLASHLPRTRLDGESTTRNSTAHHTAPSATPVNTSSHGEAHAQPCAHLAVRQTASTASVYATGAVTAETYSENAAPSHPAPEMPLTAQEKALLRIAQTSTPKQLAAIDPVEYANLEAQSALKFEKFFAPPAPPAAADANAAITSNGSSEVNPEDNPNPDSAVGPEPDSEAKP
jgi:hypothetical protein